VTRDARDSRLKGDIYARPYSHYGRRRARFSQFQCSFRDNPDYEVVAFTATQIPDIEGRTYPKELAGKLYPAASPFFPKVTW